MSPSPLVSEPVSGLPTLIWPQFCVCPSGCENHLSSIFPQHHQRSLVVVFFPQGRNGWIYIFPGEPPWQRSELHLQSVLFLVPFPTYFPRQVGSPFGPKVKTCPPLYISRAQQRTRFISDVAPSSLLLIPPATRLVLHFFHQPVLFFSSMGGTFPSTVRFKAPCPQCGPPIHDEFAPWHVSLVCAFGWVFFKSTAFPFAQLRVSHTHSDRGPFLPPPSPRQVKSPFPLVTLSRLTV